MKRLLLLLSVLFASFATCNSAGLLLTSNRIEGDDDPDKIDLVQQQNGEEPNTFTPKSISAFRIGSSILITVSNIYGYVSATVYGGGYSVESGFILANGNNVINLDISPLPSGDYCLLVSVAGTIYTGYFRK